MLDIKDEGFFKKIEGKEIDFYLEDDMFEIEGVVIPQNGTQHIKVISAVGHMLKIAGDELEIGMKYGRPWAVRVSDKKTFEMEVNRVYTGLENPKKEDFEKQFELGVTQFFNKPTDTLVWYDAKQDKWFMEVNKINMFCSGDIHTFNSLEELFQEGKEYLDGKWQCIYYSAEVEED